MKSTILLCSFLILTTSCDPAEESQKHAPSDFTENPEAVAAFDRLTHNGTGLPSSGQLAEEISDPGTGLEPDCTGGEPTISTRSRTPKEKHYNLKSNAERVALVEQIKKEGLAGRAYTQMSFGGQSYKVLNDSPSLIDGTYVPMTFPEAKAVAHAWGCKIPSAAQLKAIADHARSKGNQFAAIPRTPNNGLASQLKSVNQMMNDKRMHERSLAGEERLIDGHFKWYDDQGRIYGFAKGNGSFYQNRPSSAHVGDRSYYDYSHGVRIICPN